MNSTSPSSREDRTAARSPACWMAGPLVRRRWESSSPAMIMASVVLPSPGGPESSTWSGGLPRARAACSTRESWSRTTCWPTKSSSRLGRSAASAARSISSAPGVTTRSEPAVSVDGSATVPSQQAQGRAERARDLVGRDDLGTRLGEHLRHGVLGLLDGPAEARESLHHALGVVARDRRHLARRARRGGAGGRAQLVAQLEDDALGAL